METKVNVGITYSEYQTIVLSIRFFMKEEQNNLNYWEKTNRPEYATEISKRIQIEEQLIQKLRKLDFPIEDIINA